MFPLVARILVFLFFQTFPLSKISENLSLHLLPEKGAATTLCLHTGLQTTGHMNLEPLVLLVLLPCIWGEAVI